jgi:hypothetical protein
MKNPTIALSVAAALMLPAAMTQAQVLNISGETGASIQFNGTGSSFQFNNNGAGNQWSVTTESGGLGTATGLLGVFNGGPWTYGAISTAFGIESASVSANPASKLIINDGVGFTAMANLDWVQVSTYQSSGYLNANATVNLSNLSYSGTNPDLQSFFSAPAGTATLSFQFNPAMDLNALSAGAGPYTTSFSATLSAVPEPTSALVFGLGVLLLGCRRFFRK